MCGCLFRGGNDFFRISIWIKAGNVIRNRSIKQLYALGQIPDVMAQNIWLRNCPAMRRPIGIYHPQGAKPP